ncbi:carbohydrate-binding domain-containing protein [Tunicatimonas pelagia]|uniref:carbohydrate-binding domain-containing protein n=1 Tax=Tunicatimonas pelagia TaxID=931531 RepID=UPI0026659D43|nr:carbohydrate-binding domain-containing protein [Tunicatimonas pelagia]WKN42468.1 carbohydrate-binding domain-containing protein [Tunicatimonas pelagia]
MVRRIIKLLSLGLALGAVGLALFGKEELFCFLALTERVEAPVLVIEGWVSEEALQQAVEEVKSGSYRQIFVTSIAHDSAFRMYSQGGLCFYLSRIESAQQQSFQEIQISAYGKAAIGIQAHAKVMLDTVQVGEFTATNKLHWHTVTLSQPTQADSITIVYDNNRRVGNEDRDLFVYAIRLDSVMIPARHPAVRYDRDKLDGNYVFRTDYESIGAEAAEFLVAQGVDSAKLVTLAAPPVTVERTYASALTVKKNLPKGTEAIVLFSESTHARRSRLVYQRMFGSTVHVGVIAARSNDKKPEDWWRERGSRNYVLLQVAKYIYAKFLFFPSDEDGVSLRKAKK